MTGEFHHVPVMVAEVLALFETIPPGLVVDATIGGAGHARQLLDARPDIELLGLDRDPEAVAASSSALRVYGSRASVLEARFEQIGQVLGRVKEDNVMGVLMDLGVSSHQLDRPERGFSYRHDAPLDMRMDSTQALTAADVVNEYPRDELARIISRNGEERFASRIANAIVEHRPVASTRELVDIVRDAIPAATRRTGPHPARRTFQAIRMEVNRELPNLAAGLDDVVSVVAPGGRIVVISYHSLEDRVVKERFGDWSATEEPGTHKLPVPVPREPKTRLLTRRALRASAAEAATNSRARSARLRAVERLP